MDLPIRMRAVVSTGMSLWLAVLACLLGCALPSFANSGSSSAAAIRENPAEPSQPDLMADMANCPHHRGGSPARPGGDKPASGGMSCCPVEVTVASKPDTVALHFAPAQHFVLNAGFRPAAVQVYHAVEPAPPVWHSGRDTLLETQLLRI